MTLEIKLFDRKDLPFLGFSCKLMKLNPKIKKENRCIFFM